MAEQHGDSLVKLRSDPDLYKVGVPCPMTTSGATNCFMVASGGERLVADKFGRDDDVLYICYDNEAYMNTGIQKSSLTPFGARTTTTPAGSNVHGCLTQKKNLFEIVAAHGIPYAATASVGYLTDFMRKVEKAKGIHGARFIHVIAPCPTGWGCGTEETVDIAKEVVDSGLWYLAEYENGAFTLNRDPQAFEDDPEKWGSVQHYLRRQSRFRALTEQEMDAVKTQRDITWKRLRALSQ